MKKLSKAEWALNKFIGASCESKNDSEYIFEVEVSSGLNQFKVGNYNMAFFHNGEQKDLIINDWTFASFLTGIWVDSFNTHKVELEIWCSDPKGEEYKFISRRNYSTNFWHEAPALYMNTAMFASLFQDIDECEKVLGLYDFSDFLVPSSITNIMKRIQGINLLAEVIVRNEKDGNVPSHFIRFAKSEHRKLFKSLKDDIQSKDLLEEILTKI